MIKSTHLISTAVLCGTLLFSACGGQSTAGKTSNAPVVNNVAKPTLPAVKSGEGGGGEAGAGVETALVTYAAQGFAIGHPGPWTQDPSVTKGVKFIGGDSSMTLEFVTPAKGTDAMTYAKSDVTAVTAAFPGFKQLNLDASTEVTKAVVLGFAANGKSAVTGKAFKAHNERYYMPLADGRIAVMTVVSTEQLYDREGVRDIALTFKTTK